MIIIIFIGNINGYILNEKKLVRTTNLKKFILTSIDDMLNVELYHITEKQLTNINAADDFSEYLRYSYCNNTLVCELPVPFDFWDSQKNNKRYVLVKNLKTSVSVSHSFSQYNLYKALSVAGYVCGITLVVICMFCCVMCPVITCLSIYHATKALK